MSKIRFSYVDESESESREARAREREKNRREARAFKLVLREEWTLDQ